MESHTFTIFPDSGQTPLPELCINLWEEQKKNWPELAAAHKGLADVQTRLISCAGYEVSVQFNPARAVSSGAAIDKESIKSRPCFLCTDNLPPGQRGILYRDDYLILCNPAPIFDRHFTIVTLQHQPQEIASSLSRLLQLTADLSPDYAVFYNGPACGASAPDHLHFQASPIDGLPFLKTLKKSPQLKEISSVRFYQSKKIDRSVIILEAENSRVISEQFLRLLETTHKMLSTNGEPMINLFCTYAHASWRLTVFLRRKHRPEAYYAAGDRRFFVSPGAVDMAGVIITPLETDFNRLDCKNISDIYREVSLPEEITDKIINEL